MNYEVFNKPKSRLNITINAKNVDLSEESASLVQPNLSLSIYELARRHNMGILTPVDYNPCTYTGNTLVQRKGDDLADFSARKEEYARQVESAQNTLKTLKSKKAKHATTQATTQESAAGTTTAATTQEG